jgi:hypothetical protein
MRDVEVAKNRLPISIWGVPVRKWAGRVEYSHMGSPRFRIEFVSIWGSTYISRLNGCHIAWKMHSITLDDLNLSLVAISDSKGLYSASSSSVRTKRFIEHTLSPYSCKIARRKMAWYTYFFDEGMIEKWLGKVFPQGVLTAMTNNYCLCLLVPEE